jgi:predicted AlkP superfamily pyrophosphatase or phosphodiesterase
MPRLLPALALVACVPRARTLAAEAPDGGPDAVVLVSLDGFRPDYLRRADLPALSRLAREGVRAEALTPVFPSKTFPNHWAIATGLTTEHHGIVDNRFYDPELGEWFDMLDDADNQDPRWWQGEPIWATAERQGVRTATLFWPGSEAPVGGVRPSLSVPYDGRIPWDTRVETVLGWLELPAASRPRLLTLYFDEPDGAGHDHGPDGPEVEAEAVRADAAVGLLLDGLDARGLSSRVTVVVVSDHGMADTDDSRAVFLDDYVDVWSGQVDTWNAWAAIRPPAGSEGAWAAALADAPHMRCALREDLPPRLHYTENPRIAPLHCIAEAGWSITTRSFLRANPGHYAGGTHGYDPAEPTMAGIFIARGPGLAPAGTVVPAFENVEVYGLLAHLLGVVPADTDGDLQRVAGVLAR